MDVRLKFMYHQMKHPRKLLKCLLRRCKKKIEIDTITEFQSTLNLFYRSFEIFSRNS